MTVDNPFGDNALAYWQAGWHGVFPLPYGAKHPPPLGLTGAKGWTPSFADIHAWVDDQPHSNIGCRLPPNVIGIDVDAYNGKQGAQTLEAATVSFGPLPDTFVVSSRSDGVSGIRLYRVPEGLRWPGEVGPHVDIIQARHRYIILPPSVHPSGAPYRWLHAHQWSATPDTVPELPDGWIVGLTQGLLATDYDKPRVGVEALSNVLASFDDGTGCPAVHSYVLRIATQGFSGGSRHEQALRWVMRLVHLGTEGHIGVPSALRMLRTLWLNATVGTARDDRSNHDAQAEWERMVKGAVSVAIGNGVVRSPVDPCGIVAALVPVGSPTQPVAAATAPERAEDAPTAGQAASDAHDVFRFLVDEQAQRERVRRAARRIVDAEEQPPIERPVSMASLAEELALPDTPVVWTVETVMGQGNNATLTAQFKVGKTTLVNAYAAALADGKPFLDSFAVNMFEGRIAIWNYEVSADMYRRWMRDANVVNASRIALLHLRGYHMPLHTDDGIAWAVEWLRTNDIHTWIVDPFARALTGALDENSNGDVLRFTEALDVIKREACVSDLVLVAHTGRLEQTVGAERARGATRLDDWPDVRWTLTKDAETGVRYFGANGRDVDVPQQALHYDNVTRALSLQAGETRTKPVRVARSGVNIENEIVRALTDVPGMAINELHRFLRENGTGKRRELVLTTVKALESQGVVATVIDGQQRRLYVVSTLKGV